MLTRGHTLGSIREIPLRHRLWLIRRLSERAIGPGSRAIGLYRVWTAAFGLGNIVRRALGGPASPLPEFGEIWPEHELPKPAGGSLREWFDNATDTDRRG